MYNIFAMSMDGVKFMLTRNGVPAVFETEDDAWKMIHEFMSDENRPRFMWMREVYNADTGQPDNNNNTHPVFYSGNENFKPL